MAEGFVNSLCRCVACAIAVAALTLTPATSAAADVDFNRDVLPILSTHSFPCHGPDANKRKADLRLDLRERAVGDGGVVAPGQPDKSELIARVTADDAEGRMPPPKAGPRLTPAQVRVLRSWIEQGAVYAEHWAFLPLRRPPVPRASGWV